MTTLHIEHPISEYATWRAAFERFASLRVSAGVLAERVLRPIDDDHYIVVQLDFDHQTDAAAFLDILRDRIWTRPDASPALRGRPRTALLDPA